VKNSSALKGRGSRTRSFPIAVNLDGEQAGRPVKTASVHVRLMENSLAAK